MKKILPYIILLPLLILLRPASLSAQRYYNEGNKYYDRNLFEEAIPYYLKEIEKKGSFKYMNEAREKLANCYRLTGQFLEASEMYKYILDKGSRKNKAENLLNYGNSLKNAAKYEEAAEVFKKYMELEPDDPMGKVYLGSCAMAQKLLDEESRYVVKNIEGINTEGSEYATAMYNDGIVFSSARSDSRKKFINIADNIDVMRSDLYFTDLKNREGVGNAIENLVELNSYQHDGTATFSTDGNKVYFARTVTGDKDKKSNTVVNSLQIFYSEKDVTGHWSKPVSAFSFNSPEYSTAQPSLSPDGKRIYFASDMPGGFGNMDIYYSDLLSNGEWGEPVNLGPEINTFGFELFPFIQGSDTLYFSSDTHPGMGKLDIFRAVRTGKSWRNVSNMGVPINSIGDDFGIVFDKSQSRGFFSSDRFNGKGKEDIYTIWKLGYHDIYLSGNRISFPDLTLFNGIIYRVLEEGTTESVSLISEDGFYGFNLREGVNYTISLRKDGFFYDALKVRVDRTGEKNYLVADIQARNASYLIRGTLSEGEQKISSRQQLAEGSKKDYVTIDDTTVVEIPLPGINVLLSGDQSMIDLTVTNDEGKYSFPDTLYAGVLYRLMAVRPDKPKTPPVDQEDKKDPGSENETAGNKTTPDTEQNTDQQKNDLLADNRVDQKSNPTNGNTAGTEKTGTVGNAVDGNVGQQETGKSGEDRTGQQTGSGNPVTGNVVNGKTGTGDLPSGNPDPSSSQSGTTTGTTGSTTTGTGSSTGTNGTTNTGTGSTTATGGNGTTAGTTTGSTTGTTTGTTGTTGTTTSGTGSTTATGGNGTTAGTTTSSTTGTTAGTTGITTSGTGSSTGTNGTTNAGTGSTTATGGNGTTAGTTTGSTAGTTTGTTGSSTTGTGSSTGTNGSTNAGTGSTTATGGNGTTAGTTTGKTTGTTSGTIGSTTTGTGSSTGTTGTTNTGTGSSTATGGNGTTAGTTAGKTTGTTSGTTGSTTTGTGSSTGTTGTTNTGTGSSTATDGNGTTAGTTTGKTTGTTSGTTGSTTTGTGSSTGTTGTTNAGTGSTTATGGNGTTAGTTTGSTTGTTTGTTGSTSTGTGSSTSTNGTINAGTGSTTATGSNVTTAGTTAGKTTGTTTGTTGSSTTGTGSSTGTTGTTNAGTGSTTATGGNGTTAGTTTGSTTGTTTGTTGSTTTGTGSTTKTGGTASGAADQRATVSGVVREAESQKPVQGVDVQLFEGDDMVGQKMTGNDGAYSFDVKSGHQYDLYATRTGYFQGRAELGSVTAGSGQGNIANVSLEPVVANKDIELKNILFDFGKSGLRNESKRELDQLAVFLKANPDLTIELNAHTDTRGDYYPNLLLSYKRAEATRDYLVMRGIDEGRIYSNGFGETFPLVKNAVTDTDHEKNRRVEFRIIDKADVARGEIHSQTGFSVLAGNPYSKARPIPEAEPLPDGLNFRIDLGSYNREVSNDAFSGAFPVVKEWDPQEKVYHYYAGLFNSIDEAEDALKVIKTEVPDASGLKGYFNNNEISEDELKMIRQASGEQVDEDEPKPVLQSDYPVFSIQIGAFTKNLNQSVVADYRRTAGSYGLYINKLNGYTIYSIGLFDDPDRASAVREELIRKGISEKAFLIAWYRGQRITATEAIKMTEKKKP